VGEGKGKGERENRGGGEKRRKGRTVRFIIYSFLLGQTLNSDIFSLRSMRIQTFYYLVN